MFCRQERELNKQKARFPEKPDYSICHYYGGILLMRK